MSTQVLFSGKKCFWKANKVVPLEVLIVQHHPMQIIEIIACDLAIKCEAPHLYVSENVLLVKLGDSSCSKEVDITKAHYLLDNLMLSLYLPESRLFELNLQQSSDELSKSEGLLITKPLGLCAYLSPFVHIFRSDSVHESVLLSASRLRCGDSTTEGTGSPRRGIAETVQWSAEPHLSADIDIARGEASPSIWKILNSVKCASHPSLQHHHHQQQQTPTEKLPSSSSITDDLEQHQMPHGAPPRPLYPMKSSTSSPNLANTAGSPRNPRIVSRRVPALPIGGHEPSTLALTEPSICVSTSASAPTSHTYQYASLLHGRRDCIAVEGKEDFAALPSVVKALPLNEGNNEEDYYPADLPSQPNSPRKTGASAGMPPLHARNSAGTTEKVGVTTWEPQPHHHQQQALVEMRGHHRRHTYDHAVSIPSALAAAAVGETPDVATTGTAGDGGIPLSPRSAKSRLMGMRAALDGLRIPFMHSHRSKVSPSVSSSTLEEDLQELEEHPFG